MNLREQIENNLGLTISGFVIAGFLAGIAAFRGITDMLPREKPDTQIITNRWTDIVVVTNAIIVTNIVRETLTIPPAKANGRSTLDYASDYIRYRSIRDNAMKTLEADFRLINERSVRALTEMMYDISEDPDWTQMKEPSKTRTLIYLNMKMQDTTYRQMLEAFLQLQRNALLNFDVSTLSALSNTSTIQVTETPIQGYADWKRLVDATELGFDSPTNWFGEVNGVLNRVVPDRRNRDSFFKSE